MGISADDKLFLNEYEKSKAVVISCKTLKQLDMAIVYCKRFLKKWAGIPYGHRDLLARLMILRRDYITMK